MADITFNFGNFDFFLLILVRMASFVFLAPFFGSSDTPQRIKAGFSIFVSVVLFQVVPKSTLEYASAIGFAVIALKEGITGLLIGFAASICNSIVLFAGRLIDMEIGLSMATMFDPVSRQESSISGTMYSYFVMLLLIITNMHHYLIRALADSFTLVPVGGAIFDTGSLYSSMMGFMTDFTVIGFRIALPVFAVNLIINAVLGILAKVAPQMNIFVVGMQLKILAGLAILLLTVGMLPGISDFIFTAMKKMIVAFIKGMY